MPKPNVSPPGARLPLVILAVALAAGAALVLRVHRAAGPTPRALRSLVARPAAASPARAR